MKQKTIQGRVKRNEERNVTKEVMEGIGDDKTTKVVSERVHILTVLSNDGERITWRTSDRIDAECQEDVGITLKFGAQRKLGD